MKEVFSQHLSALLSIVALVVLMCMRASAATYYVDNQNLSASNANSGSAEQPWETISYGVTRLAPGDTLYIKRGTYFEQVTLKVSGTAAQPIAIEGLGEEPPIIDGSEPTALTWSNYQGAIYMAPLDVYRSVIIEEGRPLEPKLSLDGITAGSYYIDTATLTLYLQTKESDNPQSHSWRASAPSHSDGITAVSYPSGIKYVRLKNLEVRYSQSNGIEITGTHQNISLEKITVRWSGNNNLFLRGGSNDRVAQSLFEDSLSYGSRAINLYNETDALFTHNEVRNARCDLVNVTSSIRTVVSFNHIYNNRYGSPTHPDLIQIQKADIRNDGTIIDGNIMHGGDTLGIMASYTDNSVVRNNVLYDIDGAAIDFGYQHTNLSIYNNSLPFNSLAVAGSQSTPTTHVRIFNNIVAVARYGNYTSDFVSDNNIYVSSNTFALHWSPTKQFAPMTLEQFRTATGNEMHGMKFSSITQLDFVDNDKPDLHLHATSAAVDAGSTLAISLEYDADGASRPIGKAIDIGAYEFYSHPVPQPPTRLQLHP